MTETFNRLRNGELLEVRGYPDGSGSLGARSWASEESAL